MTLFLKEDAVELADHVRLNRLIKQYSQFITFPIKLYSPKKEAKQVSGEGPAWPGPLRTPALLQPAAQTDARMS